jgi:YfiH family protein
MTPASVLIPDWPDLPAGVGALATTRRGGASSGPYDDGDGGGGFNLGLHCGDDPQAVQQNRAALQTLLPGRPAWIAQVHGIGVVDAATVGVDQPVRTGDASFSDASNVVCAILTADCLPVLFADLDGKVVGAAHAGWRSLAGGVLAATVACMRERGAGEITAWLGPAIGPSKFEVGQDVRDAFLAQLPEAGVASCFADYPGRPGKYLADMYSLARRMLAVQGITRIHGGNRCTATERDTFYSYRRDHVTGRQASLIWLK